MIGERSRTKNLAILNVTKLSPGTLTLFDIFMKFIHIFDGCHKDSKECSTDEIENAFFELYIRDNIPTDSTQPNYRYVVLESNV